MTRNQQRKANAWKALGARDKRAAESAYWVGMDAKWKAARAQAAQESKELHPQITAENFDAAESFLTTRALEIYAANGGRWRI